MTWRDTYDAERWARERMARLHAEADQERELRAAATRSAPTARLRTRRRALEPLTALWLRLRGTFVSLARRTAP
ncbi:MAG: hypothetical protein HY329_21685 [Chloroflexi bacterium]|nr:hypothetical protein [Chloroflexota bacterium]